MSPEKVSSLSITPRTGRGPVMLVEDDHDIRVSVRSLLEDEGYEVLSVTNGKEAIEMLNRLKTQPRLIILDLCMPVMDGWDFVATLKENAALVAPPVVVQTAVDQMPPSPIAGYMRKPIDAGALLEMVGRYCP